MKEKREKTEKIWPVLEIPFSYYWIKDEIIVQISLFGIIGEWLIGEINN